MDRQWFLGWYIYIYPFIILVNIDLPFLHSLKRVWINQDVIEGPNCTFYIPRKCWWCCTVCFCRSYLFYDYILKLFFYSSNPQKLKEAVKAARSLEKALDLSGVDERLLKLAAVQDQVKLCEKRRDKFSKSITRYLNNLFIHVGNDTDNLADMSAPSVRLFFKFILNIRRYFIWFSIWGVAY